LKKNPKRRQDLEAKMNLLFINLANCTISGNTLKNLNKLVLELNRDNEQQAMFFFQEITKDDWNNNKDWLMVLKRLITKK